MRSFATALQIAEWYKNKDCNKLHFADGQLGMTVYSFFSLIRHPELWIVG